MLVLCYGWGFNKDGKEWLLMEWNGLGIYVILGFLMRKGRDTTISFHSILDPSIWRDKKIKLSFRWLRKALEALSRHFIPSS